MKEKSTNEKKHQKMMLKYIENITMYVFFEHSRKTIYEKYDFIPFYTKR